MSDFASFCAGICFGMGIVFLLHMELIFILYFALGFVCMYVLSVIDMEG